ncbi:MAG: tetratricopeptide repeat protein, partial [Burkholderiales bacterium]|nr:tetratricopeptide repeat protein [Anaerolineae bacterium]
DLIQRIQAAPHDLNMPGDFGELGRKGIKSLLDASVDALDKRLHDVFVTFGGLFEPTSTPELLALTMNADTADIRDALEQIELRGLVNSASREDIGYYRLHDLAYSYARTMFVSKGLSEGPVIEACRRYTAVYFDNLTALDIEQSNILEAASAAHETTLRTGSGSDVLVDIMRLLTVDGPYFAARGHTSHSLQLLRTAIDTATQQGEIETAHYLWSKLGNTYSDFTGDLPAALDAYQTALKLARELENTQREAVLLTVIAKIRFRQNAADSDSYYEQAERIAREHSQRHDDDFALCFVLHHRGYMEGVRGEAESNRVRLEQSRALSDEAAAIAARLGLHELHFHSLINRGAAEHELQEYLTAHAIHESAYLLAREQGNYPWMASALQSMGEDEHCLGRTEQAQRHLDEALALWRQSGGKAQVMELTGFMQRHDYTIKPE